MANGNGETVKIPALDWSRLFLQGGSFGLVCFIVYQLFAVELPEQRKVQRETTQAITGSIDKLNGVVSEQIRTNDALRSEIRESRITRQRESDHKPGGN